MRALLLFCSACFLLPTVSRCQTAAELRQLRELAAEKEMRRQELTNLENETARAIQWNTGTFFRRVYSEDFLGALPSGQVLDKTAYIANIEGSGIKYTDFHVTDIRVRVYEETAVVTCLWSYRGSRGNQNFARQSRVTHVYVYGQRGWQAVSSHETVLPG